MKEHKGENGFTKLLICLVVLVAIVCTFSLNLYADDITTHNVVMTTEDVSTEEPIVSETPVPTAVPEMKVSYSTHVQKNGWMTYVSDGTTGGTEGEAKRLESIKIKLENSPYEGGISYRTHVQKYGWMNWVSDDAISGTTGEAKRIEAIQIKLTGKVAEYYDVYYRVHVQSYGWMGWAKNGQSAGSSGASKRVEAIQICLVKKNAAAPGNTSNTFVNKSGMVNYSTHVQTLGWRNYSNDGAANGSWGINKRLEGIVINLTTNEYAGDIQYRTHVEKYGWMIWVSGGCLSGTTGESKRLEAIEIKLTGELAEHYDIYYRVHCQTYGWMNWVKNGAMAGTEGQRKRLEAIQIFMCQKGVTPKFPAAPTNKMIDPSRPMIAITYDDGPGPYTDMVLNVLDRYDAKGTFFVVGNRISTYPNQLKRAYNLGCQIGSHTWSHPMLAGLSAGAISDQMQATDQAIKQVIGVGTTIMRPPGGSMNVTVKATVGKPLITWSLDPQDWKYRNASYVTNYVLSYVRDGDIVLLHDIHYSTAVATETLIPELIRRGYQLVTVDELAYYKGYSMQAGAVYNSMR